MLCFQDNVEMILCFQDNVKMNLFCILDGFGIVCFVM